MNGNLWTTGVRAAERVSLVELEAELRRRRGPRRPAANPLTNRLARVLRSAADRLDSAQPERPLHCLANG